MADIQRIPFYDDVLYAIVDERTGKQYVLPKPMVDLFGLTWRTQHAKLRNNKLFAKGVSLIAIPTPGGEQEALLLERGLVHAWLLSIELERVAPALQDKLLRYQEECAQALDAYFSTGAAFNPRFATDATSPWDILAQMVAAGRQQAQQIQALEAAQREQDQRLVQQQAAVIEAQATALDAKSASTHADATATQANALAKQALDTQQWLTIREYCFLHALSRQMPRSRRQEYGTYLIDYCRERNIPVRDQFVADRPYKVEHAYHVGTIALTLGPWLRRCQSQMHLVTPYTQRR